MTTIAIIIDSPEPALEEGLRLMFGQTIGAEVVACDDPDLARVVRGFTYAEHQDDPEREAARMAAIVARACISRVRDGVS